MTTKTVNGFDLGLYTPNLKLYELDANTLSLENLAGGTWKNLKMGALELTSTLITGGAVTLAAAAATDGQLNDAPLLTLRNYYDADPGVGVTSTAWDLTLLHDMTAGGAAPASSGIFKINNVVVLTLTNTNGAPKATFPAILNFIDANSGFILWGAVQGLRSYGGNLATCDASGNIQYVGFLCKTLSAQNTVAVQNSDEGGTASLNIKTVRELVTLSGAQKSTTINLPAGAMLLGASFNVDTAVVTSAATNTWDADYIGGSTTNLVAAGAPGALNTKANKVIAPEIASAETNIEFDAPGVETFSSGVIEVVAYYIDQTSLANA